MLKTLTAVWYFHKPLATLGLFFSVFSIYTIDGFGHEFIPFGIAIKIVGSLGYIFYKHHFANKTYIYFLNAGYSINYMYACSICFDLALFALMLITYTIIK